MILLNHMKYGGSIFTIGIILILLPFLGFPTAWKNFFIAVSGLWLCGIVLTRLKRHQAKKTHHKKESRYSTVTPASNQAPLETFKDTTPENTHDQSPTV